MRNKTYSSKRVKVLTVFCAILVTMICITSNCYAKAPTLDYSFTTLKTGDNHLKVEYYNGSQIMAGCFTAPKKDYYTIYAVNTGDIKQYVHLLNKDFSEIKKSPYLYTSKQCDFGTYVLDKGEKVYIYVERNPYNHTVGTLASKIVIKARSGETEVTKKVEISKKTITLKKGKTYTLKLKNNTKKITWISKNPKVATVNSKGVVKGKKAGTTYIYALVNSKSYKCKVKVK